MNGANVDPYQIAARIERLPLSGRRDRFRLIAGTTLFPKEPPARCSRSSRRPKPSRADQLFGETT